MGCPSWGESLSVTVRAMMSVPLPGVNGTMILIGLAGHVCAHAAVCAAQSTVAVISLQKRNIVRFPPCVLSAFRDETVKAASFEYARAASVAEACELLRRHGDGAKLLAGGQSLVPMMAMRLVRPAWLVDINEIAELKFVKIEKDAARIGACTRQCTVERDEALAARVPLLSQALAWVGHVQTRNRGTVGGSLAHADPSAELPLAAQVLGARMLLRSAKGVRTLEAEKFFAGPMLTSVRP